MSEQSNAASASLKEDFRLMDEFLDQQHIGGEAGLKDVSIAERIWDENL